MGQCFCTLSESTIKVAIKLPHGTKGIFYNDSSQSFVECDTNQWLSSLYKEAVWTGWMVYNDETGHLGDTRTKKGHCKGIVSWNATHISWLVHSVPNFPRVFSGNTISEIESSEHIYGQSFAYTQFPYQDTLLMAIIQQVQLMESNIYIMNMTSMLPRPPKITDINTIHLTETITHFAKPPHFNMDIYEHFPVEFKSTWNVQTWKRGHPVESSTSIHDIKEMGYQEHNWSDTQDHSKWGVSQHDWVWVGDLNRMSSQMHRGGGGFIIKHAGIANAMRLLIKK